jgi:hypothetical protein
MSRLAIALTRTVSDGATPAMNARAMFAAPSMPIRSWAPWEVFTAVPV